MLDRIKSVAVMVLNKSCETITVSFLSIKLVFNLLTS